MRIAEIFHSIQGEGSLIGLPSVFIRVSGCNLRCVWCDTPYASWQPEGPDMTVDEILSRAAEWPGRPVVLTGGEPMIMPALPELTRKLKAEGRHITIETAATVSPGEVVYDLASLSPKLANATPSVEVAGGWHARHESRRRQPAILRSWLEAGRYQLKFVVCRAEEVREIDELLAETGAGVAPEKVFLMPEGRTMAELETRREWLVKLCLERGYRYAHRLHIELFGNTRGT